jgi:hypothetical protein
MELPVLEALPPPAHRMRRSSPFIRVHGALRLTSEFADSKHHRGSTTHGTY